MNEGGGCKSSLPLCCKGNKEMKRKKQNGAKYLLARGPRQQESTEKKVEIDVECVGKREKSQ